jgi:uncharacterized protein YxeA
MKTYVLIILTVTVLIVGALAVMKQRLQERTARLVLPNVCRTASHKNRTQLSSGIYSTASRPLYDFDRMAGAVSELPKS